MIFYRNLFRSIPESKRKHFKSIYVPDKGRTENQIEVIFFLENSAEKYLYVKINEKWVKSELIYKKQYNSSLKKTAGITHWMLECWSGTGRSTPLQRFELVNEEYLEYLKTEGSGDKWICAYVDFDGDGSDDYIKSCEFHEINSVIERDGYSFDFSSVLEWYFTNWQDLDFLYSPASYSPDNPQLYYSSTQFDYYYHNGNNWVTESFWPDEINAKYHVDVTYYPPPPPPLSVYISGPTSLSCGESGTFTANVSGGTGDITNYKWWKRNDIGGGGINSIDIGTRALPGGIWYEIAGWEGQQTIQAQEWNDFSLKCRVYKGSGTAEDIHSVNVNR